ncbi:MAG: hypothetical protein JXR61_03495 [Prolixibacteraceae bacterium]|nr:hypothetical protein [Prolixibacteraceae bacterium]
MKNLLIFMILFIAGSQLFAQNHTTVDSNIFPNVIFTEPNPPKPIKGWELNVDQDNALLTGEYPGKIIKFQFKGDAVGIEVISVADAGLIEYSIDGVAWKRQDLYVPASIKNQESLFFTLGENLKNRRHTLQIRLIEDRNTESLGNKCTIRNFYINSPE